MLPLERLYRLRALAARAINYESVDYVMVRLLNQQTRELTVMATAVRAGLSSKTVLQVVQLRLTPDAGYPTAEVFRTGIPRSFRAFNDQDVHVTVAPITTQRGRIGVFACGHRGTTPPPLQVVTTLAAECAEVIERRRPVSRDKVATG